MLVCSAHIGGLCFNVVMTQAARWSAAGPQCHQVCPGASSFQQAAVEAVMAIQTQAEQQLAEAIR